MKERPLIFSAPMVKALLAGHKTQTRRVLKSTTEHKGPYNPAYVEAHRDSKGWGKICPYGIPGDQMWVRESFRDHMPFGCEPLAELIEYKATPWPEPITGTKIPKWRPSIHMPRQFSRLILEITGVRVERVQDISEADADAEGADTPAVANIIGACWSKRDCFAKLWSTIHAIDGQNGWKANPWVWVIEFKVIGGAK